ncbi:uncharacterized protein LOC112525569 isoform X2 [Cynara cardunculus var. scolymus]|uniref:Glycine-rich protein n=1 Tax=Cynara cardunculus var. scolymus TaxID=59895 RepID=A0A103YAL9_CYNCS|nr:uncharacterized protein LOC112525569 isoform X2 [Cynara cardunculus var. scolymus]KVI05589.1 hypothetical protein Ccrd_016087 [Cynara cardunculus var. scolymus]
MASVTATSDVTDGPVLTLINKRIRNLRKKLNRVAQLEDSIAQGKSIIKNKEQEELLKTKPTIIAAVDELEKFRQSLSVAVDEEINLALQRRNVAASHNNDDDDVDNSSKAQTLDKEQQETEQPVLGVEDLLSLIYFASMFDVKSQSDFNSIMLTRTHERNCCLTYDYVTDDDAAVMLGERDLDLISMMGSLLISRPVDSSLSHQNALQRCIEHAKLWLSKSEQQIDSNSNVTYAALREKLTKIMGSDYFKITPEMKATADVAAEAAGNYSFQVPVQVEGSVSQYEQKQEDDVTDLQRSETYEDQSGPVEDFPKDEADGVEIPVHKEPIEAHGGNEEYKEQQASRRPYQNQRGGGRGGGGGGRRGYPNGRGARSGGRGGPYQNGRNQYYDQPGNYYPRNYYGGKGRGGGRGNGGNAYNHPGSGVEDAES